MSRGSPVSLVSLVCLVSLVHLVELVSLVQPNRRDRPERPDRPNRPNEQDRLAARILGRSSSWRECERVAQAEQDHFQRHVEIEVPRGALLGHLNLTEQVQQRIGVGLLCVGF